MSIPPSSREAPESAGCHPAPGRERHWTPRVSGMCLMMLADEAKAGRTPIYPHNAPDWLDVTDWEPWPVLALADGELHIIAVNSTRPGSLRRLIAGAQSAGLAPVVVCPFAQMTAILEKWGWRETVTGIGWNRREEWRP